MSDSQHLLLCVPQAWNQDQKGQFYESFIKEMLRPMRLTVVSRLRFTGMEIDLLAQGEDQPRTILVECKAHSTPLPADVITKLIGEVYVRGADSGWLFSTSDLTKDGRGAWYDIQNNPELHDKFAWFPPSKTIEILISQHTVIAPQKLEHHLEVYPSTEHGDWTLVVSPDGFNWLVELIEDGMPLRYIAFNARNGIPLSTTQASAVAADVPRFSALQPTMLPRLDVLPRSSPLITKAQRAFVAKVISGDSWDDLRPARPVDFVGRDEVIGEIATFLEQVRLGATSTRTIAIQAPSGWGKSSLILKIVDIARNGKRIRNCSVTAVDSRSAVNAAFVTEALRVAFVEARERGLIRKTNELTISGLRAPLDSHDILDALEEMEKNQTCIVLILDQFEELLAREALFDTFNAVRELSLEIDSRRLPLVIGFAWKTDVSLPQQHPAYHMWHSLEDRRKTIWLREFGGGDIPRVITRAEKASGRTLQRVLRVRISEQCQGFPWLLKKLLVHVLPQAESASAQFELLEKELDIEALFKEDLSRLSAEHIRCLKYVAAKSPVSVSEVGETFKGEVIDILVHSHLLIRSGMNYAVYWDIFRDYLIEGRVPEIPWARIFQRGPNIAVRLLGIISIMGPISVPDLSRHMGLSEGSTFNVLSDVVALQWVNVNANGLYERAAHLENVEPQSIARFTQSQLRRHIVVRELSRQYEKSDEIEHQVWQDMFAKMHPRASTFSEQTIHTYAGTFLEWLIFSGIVERRGSTLVRATVEGRQFALVGYRRTGHAAFIGSASPKTFSKLIRILIDTPNIRREELENLGYRNAISDSITLGIIAGDRDGTISLLEPHLSFDEIILKARSAVLEQDTIKLIAHAKAQGINDRIEYGRRIEASLGVEWKATSRIRNTNGLLRYYVWATMVPKSEQLHLLQDPNEIKRMRAKARNRNNAE